MPEHDVIVIGAGQAGLAAAHAPGRTGLRCTVLEAGEQPGSRPLFHDSLTLFSPAKHCALPGLPFNGDQGRCPHRDEAAAAAAYGPDGRPARPRGTSTTVPGLSDVGLPGQTRGAGRDAAHVARHVQQQLSTTRPWPATVPVGSGRG